MTQNLTPAPLLRIRIREIPDGEFDEFDLRAYRAGATYDVPVQLASMLIIAGYAELAVPIMSPEASREPARKAPALDNDSFPHEMAADAPPRRRRRPRKR